MQLIHKLLRRNPYRCMDAYGAASVVDCVRQNECMYINVLQLLKYLTKLSVDQLVDVEISFQINAWMDVLETTAVTTTLSTFTDYTQGQRLHKSFPLCCLYNMSYMCCQTL